MAKRKRSGSLMGKKKRSGCNPDQLIVQEAPTSNMQIQETMIKETQSFCSAPPDGIRVMVKRITRSVTRDAKDSRSTPQQIRNKIIVKEAPALILQNEIEEPVPVELHQTPPTSTLNIEDVISEDGILCSIMSSLPLREAVRTSILSPRWKNLWTNLPILKLNATNMLDAHTARLVQLDNKTITNSEKFNLIVENRDKFIRSVNLVLQQRHSGATLDEFWIRYFVPSIHSDHLDAWIHFAVTAKTKQLNVQLHRPFNFKQIEIHQYEFPFHLLRSSSSIEILNLSCCSLRPPCNFDGLKHLKELDLMYIDIIEEDINHLLSNCFSLESLSLWNLPRLVSLSIPDSLIRFQHLTVRPCELLREIKINHVRFNTLNYWGPPVDFRLRRSSQIKFARVFFCIRQSQHNLDYYLNKLSRELPHLESLRFLISGVSEVAELPKGFNSFIYLRKLVWVLDVKLSLLFLGNVLDAAPFLEELNVLCSVHVRVVEPPIPGLSEIKEMLPRHHHNALKAAKISGFYFDQWQIEIALYFLNNATELETLKIEIGPDFSQEICETYVRNFSQVVPSNVKFVVL